MMDSRQLPTTSSEPKGNRGRYSLETPPPAAHISYKPEMVGMQFGWVRVISPEKRWNRGWNHCYVMTQCVGCKSIQWQEYGSLRTGKSNGCQQCSQPRQIPKWLEKRLAAAKQRCENPKDPGYHNYGARGIKFAFKSVLAAGQYLLQLYGQLNRDMEIDRIDTNGDYAPGNIRLTPHSTNCSNQRRCVLSRFEQRYWPYSYTTVIRKLSSGMTREQIIESARTAVQSKRKNWRQIEERLMSMTYEMPESITILPYRESSSTSAATEAV